MIERSRATESSWVDPDDAPELTDEHFARGVVVEGDKLVRRGRPKLDRPKEQVTLRLDAHVLDYFRHDGPGWQTRINDALAQLAEAGRRKAQDRVIERAGSKRSEKRRA